MEIPRAPQHEAVVDGPFAFFIALCGVLALVMGGLGVVAYRREGRAGDARGRRGR